MYIYTFLYQLINFKIILEYSLVRRYHLLALQLCNRVVGSLELVHRVSVYLSKLIIEIS